MKHYTLGQLTITFTTDDGPVPTRRVAIHYTTSMPWEKN